MTTATFYALMKPTGQALAFIKNRYCPPPAYAPAEPVTDFMVCPRCKSRLNFTVLVSGVTSGHCVAAGCIRWNGQ